MARSYYGIRAFVKARHHRRLIPGASSQLCVMNRYISQSTGRRERPLKLFRSLARNLRHIGIFAANHLKHRVGIGNGDLDSAYKVVDAFRRYDVDGVMIARACLGRPWLFAQCEAALRGQEIPPDPTLAEQRACLLHHFDLIVQRFGEDKGAQLMRRYACCYAQGRHGARAFRTHAAKVRSAAEFHSVVEEYFPRDKPVDTTAAAT